MNKLTSFAARFARLLPLNIIQREEGPWVQYRKGFRWVWGPRSSLKNGSGSNIEKVLPGSGSSVLELKKRN